MLYDALIQAGVVEQRYEDFADQLCFMLIDRISLWLSDKKEESIDALAKALYKLESGSRLLPARVVRELSAVVIDMSKLVAETREMEAVAIAECQKYNDFRRLVDTYVTHLERNQLSAAGEVKKFVKKEGENRSHYAIICRFY